jgi:hypothetical protein
MTCDELVAHLEGRGTIDLNFDPGAMVLGVAATHPELCIPNGIVLGTLEAVFVHWADSNPKLMNMPAWDCVARAYSESFPCRK